MHRDDVDPPLPGSSPDWVEEESEQIPKHSGHGRRRSAGLRHEVDRLQRLTGPVEREAPRRRTLVIAVSRGACTVDLDGAAVVCALHPRLAGLQRSEIATGDEVEIELRPGANPLAVAVVPRRSVLSRPDPHAREVERVVVANIDVVVVVASLRRPPLRAGLVDRYLVAVARGGATPLLAVNKVDLADADRATDPELAVLADYAALELPVVLCSAETGEGIAELRSRLAGKTCAFVGHSGVGKSSLLNAIDPSLALAIGEVSAGRPIGRHTTRQATLHRLAGGTRVIDTPGIRELGLWRVAPRELATFFPELAAVATGCRYADCTHSHEPSCAVRDAVAAGEIPAGRFAVYSRILASLAADEG